MRWAMMFSLLGVSLFVAGCAEEPTETNTEVAGPGINFPEAPPPPPPPPRTPPALPYPRGGGSWDNPQLTAEKAAKDRQRVKAEVGAGKRGRGLDDEKMVKMIVTPARTLFRVRERVIFDVQVPKALQLYSAINGKPKTHREFMENVIIRNRIALPELPPGQHYVYDPETEQLMVEKPAR